MAFTNWRGTVGAIKPTMRGGTLGDLYQILPDGIGVIPLFLDVRRGTTEELRKGVEAYAPLVARLAEQNVDLILPEGAPPFMLLGYDGETKMVKGWERQYKVPVITSGQNHVRALNAFKVKRFVGASYFPGKINDVFARYFSAAGFEVLAMEGIDVPFDRVNLLAPQIIYAHIKKMFLKHRNKAEAIYLLGSAWKVMDMIKVLEQDLGVPVIHPTTARSWIIQQYLHVRQPVTGFGRLVAELPKG